MLDEREIAQSDKKEANSTNQSNFMSLKTDCDPMHKREKFAISLRKEKKKSILAAKRQKMTDNMQKNGLLIMSQDMQEQSQREQEIRDEI